MMGIMALSKPSETIYDPIRQEWVKKTPEEEVRRYWLMRLVEELGYPPALIAVEKEIRQLPHLQNISYSEMPKRRVDIVIFVKQGGLFPLLLLECKAVPLLARFERQVVGYNRFVQAPFVGLANREQMKIGSFDEKEKVFHFVEEVPSYHMLIDRWQSHQAPHFFR